MNKVDYERRDYQALVKEFGCHLRLGRYGIEFLPKRLGGGRGLVRIMPLNGWVTDSKEVERIIRERGLEL